MLPLREGNSPAIILLPAPEAAPCSTEALPVFHRTLRLGLQNFQKSLVTLKASAVQATKQQWQSQIFFLGYNDYVFY